MNILLVNNNTTYISDLAGALDKYNLKLITPNEISEQDLDNFDLVILSGGHGHGSVVSNPEFYKQETDLLKNTDKPIFGICLGFELIAHNFGCQLTRVEPKVKGIVKINYLESGEEISVYENHRWVVTELSHEIQGIANSQFGYEIIRHKTKPIIGFQFHPEIVEPKNQGIRVFEQAISNFI